MFNTLFLENFAVYEMMWKNIDVACGNTSSKNGLHTVTYLLTYLLTYSMEQRPS